MTIFATIQTLNMRWWILFGCLCMLGCSNADLDRAKTENEQLKHEINQKDSLIIDFTNTLNQLGANLNMIDSTKNYVKLMVAEGKLTEEDKQSIISNVNLIQSLMNKNDSLLDSLSIRFTGMQFGNIGLENFLTNMAGQIDKKEIEVNELKYELAGTDEAFESFDFHLELLSTVNIEQAETIKQQEDKLNRAWYLIGGYKYLKAKGVIGKEKGFFKLGKKLQGDAYKSLFKQVDIRQFNSVSAKGKKVKIATSHPSDSYTEIQEGVDYKLQINDPAAFWRSSRYLVIIAD